MYLSGMSAKPITASVVVIRREAENKPVIREYAFALKLIRFIPLFAYGIVTTVLLLLEAIFLPRMRQNSYRSYLKYIDYWYLEVDKTDGTVLREIGFSADERPSLIAPYKAQKGYWVGRKVQLNPDEPLIDPVVFEDVTMGLVYHSMEYLKRKYEEYKAFWKELPSGIAPQFPVLIFYPETLAEVICYSSIDKLSQDGDFGQDWIPGTQCMDSNGRVYHLKYINFGHPVGCIFPECVSHQLTLSESIAYFTNCCPRLAGELKEVSDYPELFNQIEKLIR